MKENYYYQNLGTTTTTNDDSGINVYLPSSSSVIPMELGSCDDTGSSSISNDAVFWYNLFINSGNTS